MPLQSDGGESSPPAVEQACDAVLIVDDGDNNNNSNQGNATPPPSYRDVVRAVALANSIRQNNSNIASYECKQVLLAASNSDDDHSNMMVINDQRPPMIATAAGDVGIAFSVYPANNYCDEYPAFPSADERNEWRNRAKRMAWYSILWLGWLFCGIKALILAYRSTSDIKDYKASIKLSRLSFVLGKMVIVVIILLTVVGRARLEMSASQMLMHRHHDDERISSKTLSSRLIMRLNSAPPPSYINDDVQITHHNRP